MGGKYIQKKKKTGLLIPVFLLALVLSVGITFAYMFRVTQQITNTFEKAVVRCEVIEEFDSARGIKRSICVRNTGNIDAYLRVKLVSYWINSEGNIIAKQATIPSFTLATGWIDEGNDVYLYNTPIAPEGFTPNLFATGQSITLETDVDGSRQVIEVFAEAIQINAAVEWTN